MIEADVQAAGIGERTEDVVEKWPPKRDHRLEARYRRPVTARIGRRVGCGALHPRALASGQDEGFHAFAL